MTTLSLNPTFALRALLAGALTSIAMVVLAAAPAAAAHRSGDTLRAGHALRAGDTLRSADGRFVLAMQRDGNLVLYHGRRPLWSSQTAGHPGAFAALGRHGNLVVYATGRTPLYATATATTASAARHTRLVVRNRGEAALVRSRRTVWSSTADVVQLSAGQILRPGQSRSSRDRHYRLDMQPDGNLVLHEEPSHRPLWSSQSAGNPGARAVMQTDGNLVVYGPSGAPLFQTGARGDASSRLVVQTDGNVVVYAGSGAPLWSSKLDGFVLTTGQILRAGQWRTSIDDRFLLTMQPDGNLVLYEEPSHRPLWSSNTANNPGAWATLQPDGNLVVYSGASQPLFTSRTHGDPGTKLVVQTDGNVVIYDGADRPLWSTRTTRIP